MLIRGLRRGSSVVGGRGRQAPLPHLTTLSLSHAVANAPELADLTSQPNLNHLAVIDGSAVNLAALAIHPRLTKLSFHGASDPDLAAVATLPHLTELTIEGMPGIDLSPLQANPGIRVTILD